MELSDEGEVGGGVLKPALHGEQSYSGFTGAEALEQNFLLALLALILTVHQTRGAEGREDAR